MSAVLVPTPADPVGRRARALLRPCLLSRGVSDTFSKASLHRKRYIRSLGRLCERSRRSTTPRCRSRGDGAARSGKQVPSRWKDLLTDCGSFESASSWLLSTERGAWFDRSRLAAIRATSYTVLSRVHVYSLSSLHDMELPAIIAPRGLGPDAAGRPAPPF